MARQAVTDHKFDAPEALDPGDGTQTGPLDEGPVAMALGTVAHVMDGTCWCQPTTAYEDPLTGDRVFVHRRFMDAPS